MILLHCFAGCGAAEVISAIGLEFADLFPPRESFRHNQRHTPNRPNYDAIAAIHALAHELRTVAMIAENGNAVSAISEDDRDRLAIASNRIHRALAAVAQDPKRGRHGA